MLASAENEEVLLGGNNRDRDLSWTYLQDCFIVQRCEVLEYIFSVITSGVICVLKLCYASLVPSPKPSFSSLLSTVKRGGPGTFPHVSMT